MLGKVLVQIKMSLGNMISLNIWIKVMKIIDLILMLLLRIEVILSMINRYGIQLEDF